MIASSAIISNSAPILIFEKASQYLSLNYDNTIEITAGTFSNRIDITSSNNQEFITNVMLNVSSEGLTFEPNQIFLRIGDQKGQFRIGADSSLLPISYIINTAKTENPYSAYTITTNNNIKITNKPVNIPLPTSIDIPIGGCS